MNGRTIVQLGNATWPVEGKSGESGPRKQALFGRVCRRDAVVPDPLTEARGMDGALALHGGGLQEQ